MFQKTYRNHQVTSIFSFLRISEKDHNQLSVELVTANVTISVSLTWQDKIIKALQFWDTFNNGLYCILCQPK